MNKKLINGILIASLMAGGAASFTSCSDYGDDIDNLQSQIDGITAQVSDLQSKIQSGKIISSVVATDNGLAITIDGTTYNITNGKDGDKGADASVWSIGEDGFWYKDGVKTDYKAIGTDGKDGQDGKDGADGKDGNDGAAASGIYYVPNVETGMFDIYKDGEKVESTEIAWNTASGSGMTAVFDGVKLILSGVEGAEDALELYPGVPVGSLAFVPSKMSNGLMQINDPFYLIANYLSDKDAKGAAIAKGNPLASIEGLNASNKVELVYRVNPNNATVNVTGSQFINRVISRAEGDATTLLNVVGTPTYAKGELTVTASANYAAFKYDEKKNPIAAQTGESNVVAFQLWNGQAVTTSDYVEVTSMNPLTPVLGNISQKDDSKVGITGTGIYKWNNVLGSDSENATGIAAIAANLTKAAAGVAYNDANGIDLTTVVALTKDDYTKTLEALGFENITYTFTLPKEYNVGATNQQAFVTLNGSTLTVVQSGQLAGTQAIGRTPIVRVDGMVDGKLVNRSYIKIEIMAKTVTVEGTSTEISAAKNYNYSEIGTALDKNGNHVGEVTVASMDWKTVNEILYGNTGLTSKTFWDNFNTPVVTITTTDTNGKEVEYPTTGAGINVKPVDNNKEADNIEQNSAAVSIAINNKIKTQNTYKDMGNGAQYNVAITYKSKNSALYGDIVLTQVINVKDNFKGFTFTNLVPGTTNTVVATGKFVDDSYNMMMLIDDAFITITEKGVDQKASTYMSGCYNVASVKVKNITPLAKDAAGNATVQLFKLDGNTTPVEADLNAATSLAPAAAMTAPDMTANMQYGYTLVNGESSKTAIKFNVQFKNPFVVASKITEVKINGNSSETVTENVWQNVNVVTASDAKQVFGLLNKTTFGLGAVAKNFGYAPTATGKTLENWPADSDPTIKYSFVENDAYKSFIKEATGATLGFSEKEGENGVLNYTHPSIELQNTYSLTVKAIVTFEDLSVVEVNIPVIITGAAK